MSLENAILETLAYSDIFDYPLTLAELQRYLVVSAPQELVTQCASSMQQVASSEGYFHLAGRGEIVGLRKQRAAASRKVYARAMTYGRILGSLPFVRMAALTGSLAVMNLSAGGDLDYMLVTKPGRLWTARAFAVLFGRMTRPFGHTVCVNLLVSENLLDWPVHDLYSAREMCQMIPITGPDVYRRLRAANAWTESILPNAALTAPDLLSVPPGGSADGLRHVLEIPLRGDLGERFEASLRKIQMRRITRRFGTGIEANFTADVCQGHFHNHRHLADQYFHSRLASLGLAKQPQQFASSLAAQ